MKRKKWIQKCDTDDKRLPIPTQIVSNEEFAPPEPHLQTRNTVGYSVKETNENLFN